LGSTDTLQINMASIGSSKEKNRKPRYCEATFPISRLIRSWPGISAIELGPCQVASMADSKSI
jgi:hypothetical protein